MLTVETMLTVEANMYAFNGTHWFDKKKKARFMLYAGQTFIWNPTRELWELYTERGRFECWTNRRSLN